MSLENAIRSSDPKTTQLVRSEKKGEAIQGGTSQPKETERLWRRIITIDET